MTLKPAAVAVLACLLAACQYPAPGAPPAAEVGTPTTPAPAGPAQSPWDAARMRGAVIRGIGTEPGWSVDIGAGPRPTLHATLDYGQRELHVDQTLRSADAMTYTGTAADGTAVRLQLERGECSDTMSDERYPASAVLSVGEQRYQGCARFLQP